LHRAGWILGIGVGLYIALFFTLSILRYKAFFSYEWEDLAEINRAYWNLSQGNIVGLFQLMLQDGTYYKIHIAFIMLFVSMIYAFSPHIYTLFFIITFSLAITAVPIYKIGTKLLNNKWIALLLSMAYLFYAPKNTLNFLDGDPSIFVIPFILFAFYAAQVGKRGLFILFSILVMLCRTETPAYITVLALYFVLNWKKFNKISKKTYITIGCISFGLLIFNFNLSAIISEENMCYACRESSLIGTVWYIMTHPTFSFLSDAHIQGLLKFTLPVLFAPIFTVEMILGLPSLFMIIAMEDFVYQRAHYMVGLIPVIFIGSIYLVRRVQVQWSTKWATYLAAAIFIGCLISNFTNNIIGGPYPQTGGIIEDARFLDATNIYDKRFYVMDAEDKIAWRMINLIPKDPDVAVSASGDLLVPLSSRKKIVEFLDEHYDYHNVDYILIHNKHMYMGAGHYLWDGKRMEDELKQLKISKDWNMLAQEGTFYLFKRVSKG